MEYSIGLEYLMLIGSIVVTGVASIFIKYTYNKTIKIESKKNMNGHDTARKILDNNGLKNITLGEIAQELGDHYDPQNKNINLSTDIYRKATLASISVAAHECGHAVQDKDDYYFLRLRSKLVPVVNLASKLGYVAIMIGLLSSLTRLVWIGIFLECIILFFQLITLPVEFDASRRGLRFIQELNIVEKDELIYCRKMLRAAALTYVASVATSLLEIFRLILITRRDD